MDGSSFRKNDTNISSDASVPFKPRSYKAFGVGDNDCCSSTCALCHSSKSPGTWEVAQCDTAKDNKVNRVFTVS